MEMCGGIAAMAAASDSRQASRVRPGRPEMRSRLQLRGAVARTALSAARASSRL